MSLRATVFAFAATLLLVASGCTPRMRPAMEAEVVHVPPPGKALVNFHRPSGYGDDNLYVVFDKTDLVGFCYGEQRFQWVCDPGEHVFIGNLLGSIWGTVSVIKADLAADKIYDCVVDLGFFKSSIALNPIPKDDERREDIPEWEEDDEDTMVLNEAWPWEDFQARRHESNVKILQDFLEGDKQDRLKVLAADDCR